MKQIFLHFVIKREKDTRWIELRKVKKFRQNDVANRGGNQNGEKQKSLLNSLFTIFRLQKSIKRRKSINKSTWRFFVHFKQEKITKIFWKPSTNWIWESRQKIFIFLNKILAVREPDRYQPVRGYHFVSKVLLQIMIPFLVVFFSIVILFHIFIYHKYNLPEYARRIDKIPGPTGVFYFGSSLKFYRLKSEGNFFCLLLSLFLLALKYSINCHKIFWYDFGGFYQVANDIGIFSCSIRWVKKILTFKVLS